MRSESSPPFPLPAREWLLRQVDIQPDGCWIARGHRTNAGYVEWRVPYGGGWTRRLPAHRWAYLIFVGPIPDGYHIDHRCHPADGSCLGDAACPHRLCCNPAHLAAVTPRENVLRGEGIAARYARRTTCAHGHPFDDANTRIDWRGVRRCRACARLRHQRPDVRALQRAWWADDPGRKRAANRAYWQAHKEQINARKRAARRAGADASGQDPTPGSP